MLRRSSIFSVSTLSGFVDDCLYTLFNTSESILDRLIFPAAFWAFSSADFRDDRVSLSSPLRFSSEKNLSTLTSTSSSLSVLIFIFASVLTALSPVVSALPSPYNKFLISVIVAELSSLESS